MTPSPNPASEVERICDEAVALTEQAGGGRTNWQAAYHGAMLMRAALEATPNARVLEAAQALIDDVRRRYPGEDLRCHLMRDLDAALSNKG